MGLLPLARTGFNLLATFRVLSLELTAVVYKQVDKYSSETVAYIDYIRHTALQPRQPWAEKSTVVKISTLNNLNKYFVKMS
jgi:hypothetical protein